MPKQFTIYGAKQRGRLSHFTKDINTLIDILKSRELQPGGSEEYNPNTGREGRYISFSRDMLAATKRSSKWKFGLIINGDYLSENYNITPYSYEWVNDNKINFRVKVLTLYENGQCTVQFVGKNTTSISLQTYEHIRDLVVNYDRNVQAKLFHQKGGRRKTKGTYLKEKFTYNNPQGGVQIPYSDLPLELRPFVDEYEERFWVTPKQSYIRLNGRIIEGIILPRSLKSRFESVDDRDLQMLHDLMDNLCGQDNYNVMYY